MIATQSTTSVHWRALIRSDHAKLPNKTNGSWQRFSRIWAFLASATAHGVIVALLVNNAAEPLPMGRPMVVELVFEKAGKSTIGDATKNLKPLDTPSMIDDIGEIITGTQPDGIEGPSIPMVVAPVRPTSEISVDVSAPSKLVAAVPEPKSADVLIPAPRTLEQSMDRRKRDRVLHWTANIPVPRPRPKPPLQSKIQQAPLSSKNDGPAQQTILEEGGRTVVKRGDEGKIRGVQAGLPAEVQTKGASAPRGGGIASIARGGLETKTKIGPEGIGEAAQLPGNPPPRYPARAVRRGWQGRVILDVEVLPSGKAGLVGIAMSSGYGVLDRSARKTVQKWRFKAARRAGIPYRSKVRVPVQFKLEK